MVNDSHLKNRVAVCMSGQPRFVKECQETIKKNLIEKYKADVYIHSWDYSDIIGQPFNIKYPDRGIVESNFKESLMLYNPVKIQLEKPIFDSADWLSGVKSMFYSFHKSIELVDTEKYDCIVKIRSDNLLYNCVIDFDYLDYFNTTDFRGKYYCKDIIFYSSGKNMKRISEIYRDFDFLFNSLPQDDRMNETLIGKKLEICNIPVRTSLLHYDMFRMVKNK